FAVHERDGTPRELESGEVDQQCVAEGLCCDPCAVRNEVRCADRRRHVHGRGRLTEIRRQHHSMLRTEFAVKRSVGRNKRRFFRTTATFGRLACAHGSYAIRCTLFNLYPSECGPPIAVTSKTMPCSRCGGMEHHPSRSSP